MAIPDRQPSADTMRDIRDALESFHGLAGPDAPPGVEEMAGQRWAVEHQIHVADAAWRLKLSIERGQPEMFYPSAPPPLRGWAPEVGTALARLRDIVQRFVDDCGIDLSPGSTFQCPGDPASITITGEGEPGPFSEPRSCIALRPLVLQEADVEGLGWCRKSIRTALELANGDPETVWPSTWIVANKTDLLRSCDRSPTNTDYFRRQTGNGLMQMEDRGGGQFAIRFRDPDRHEQVREMLRRLRGL